MPSFVVWLQVVEKKFHVKDFWYRVEYQHRGSPHVHGLLWLRDAPDVSNLSSMSDEQWDKVASYFDKYVTAYHPDPSCPPAQLPPCRRSPENVDNVEQDLAELLNRVQMHTCSKSYCMKFNS